MHVQARARRGGGSEVGEVYSTRTVSTQQQQQVVWAAMAVLFLGGAGEGATGALGRLRAGDAVDSRQGQCFRPAPGVGQRLPGWSSPSGGCPPTAVLYWE